MRLSHTLRESVATGKELLGGNIGKTIVCCMFGLNIGGIAQLPVVILEIIIHAHHFRSHSSLGHLVGGPSSVLTRLSGVVDVVDICHNSQLRTVGETHRKKSGQIALMLPAASIDIAYPSSAILTLQFHIHHEIGRFHPCRIIDRHTTAVEELHMTHHIGRKIIEHQLPVTIEKLPTVEEKAFHLATVSKNLTILIDTHPWHLADEVVEHRSFR